MKLNRKPFHLLLILFILTVFLSPQSNARADAFITVTNGTSTIADGDGCSLPEAIINAQYDDTSGSTDCPAGDGADTITLDVNVSLTSIYPGSRDIGGGQAGLPDIGSEITIQAGAGNTITRSSGTFRIFYVTASGNLTLSDLSVLNGRIAPTAQGEKAYGGGIYLRQEAELYLLESTLSNNTAKGANETGADKVGAGAWGGGIYAESGTFVSISNSSFTGNIANGGNGDRNTGGLAAGGAIHSMGEITSLTGNLFSSNQAVGGLSDGGGGGNGGEGRGGGISTSGVIAQMSNNTFVGNVAAGGRKGNASTFFGGDGKGGGLYLSGTVSSFSNNTFSNNVAQGGNGSSNSPSGNGSGGGIYSDGHITLIANSTFSGNFAYGGSLGGGPGLGHGGGIFIESYTTSFLHTTFLSNIARNDGDVIHTAVSVSFVASIASSPTSATIDCKGTITDGGNNLHTDDGDTSCPGSPLTIGTDIDGTLADNSANVQTHALLAPSSVAINGTGGSCPAVGDLDQRGVTRDSDCDIGAFEYVGILPEVSYSILNPAINEFGFPTSTIVSVTAADLNSGTISVAFSFSGTAENGLDFLPIGLGASKQLSLSPSNNPAFFFVAALPDALVEGTESVDIQMDRYAGAFNLAGTNPQSLSILDYLVQLDPTPPTVLAVEFLDGTLVTEGGSYPAGSGFFRITFSEDLLDHAGWNPVDDVTNPSNYKLMLNDVTEIPILLVSYQNNSGAGPYQTLVVVNDGNALPAGDYTFTVNGSTSITDYGYNSLDGDGDGTGGDDHELNFTVLASASTDTTDPAILPDTGFIQGRITDIPIQPATKEYAELGGLWIEIPKLGVQAPIVGVPVVDGDWDVSWLYDSVGWLEGTAYPSLSGNTVITGHVWDANNKPGSFAYLRWLRHGDQFSLHIDGSVYTYEVQKTIQVLDDDLSVLAHSDQDIVTLLTCEGYSIGRETYPYRRAVQAVLISIQQE